MKRMNRRGVSPLEVAILSTFVMAVTIFILSHFQQSSNIFNILIQRFDPELNDTITKWKNNADLVIVGKLTNRYDEVGASHMNDYTGLVFFDINVEKVEHGRYPYDEIEVYIGMYSNVVKLQDYPPFLKKNYREGDRVRIYVYYDYVKNAYYTPGGLLTVEPLS